MTTEPDPNRGKVGLARGIAPFLIGLTWSGPIPRVQQQNHGPEPTRAEIVLVVAVTLVCVAVAGWVGWRWTGHVAGGVLAAVGGLFIASVLLQVGHAVVRLSRRARR